MSDIKVLEIEVDEMTLPTNRGVASPLPGVGALRTLQVDSIPQLATLTNLLVITFSVDTKSKYKRLKPSKFLRRRSGSPERNGANGNGPNRSPRRDYGILFVVRGLAGS